MPIDPTISLQVQHPNIDMAGALQQGQQNALAIQHQQWQMQAQRESAQSLADDRRSQAEVRKQTLAERQQAVTSQQVIDHLMQNAMVESPDTPGLYTLDRQAITQAAVQGGNGHLLPQIAPTLDKMDEYLKKTNSARNETIAQALYGVQENGNTPGAVQTAIAMLGKNRLIDTAKLQPLIEAVDQHQSPDAIGAMMQHLGQGIPEYRALVESEATKKAALSKTTAEARKVNAEATNLETYGHGTAPEHKLVEVTEPDGSQGFRVFNGTTLLPLSAEGVGPKRPAQTPEPMQLKEVTGPDGSLALANYNPRSGQLSPVQAPGFAPKQPTQPAAAPPNMRTVNVVVDGQPKVATFNPQTGRLTVDGEDITGRAAPMQAPQTGPNLQRAEMEVDGQPAVVNFNPRAGTYTDPSGADISARVRPKSASSSSGSDFDKFLTAYAQDLGKTPSTLTAKDRLAAREKWARADDKPTASQLPPQGDWNKTGAEFLKTIPVEWRKTVEKLAKYDEDPAKASTARGGMRETVMRWVNQVNPDYDQSKFGIRTKTRQSYTTGTQGQQINAINTAIGHIDQLDSVAADMKNSDFVPGNKAFNALRTAFGSDKVTNFDTLKDALAGEVSSVLAKGGATVSGIAEAKQKISASNSPRQLAGYVKTLIPIMGSKLAELDAQYKQAMGDNDSFAPLSQHSKDVLTKMGFDPEHPTIGRGSSGPSAGAKVGRFEIISVQ